jgi:hypothetical protein
MIVIHFLVLLVIRGLRRLLRVVLVVDLLLMQQSLLMMIRGLLVTVSAVLRGVHSLPLLALVLLLFLHHHVGCTGPSSGTGLLCFRIALGGTHLGS